MPLYFGGNRVSVHILGIEVCRSYRLCQPTLSAPLARRKIHQLTRTQRALAAWLPPALTPMRIVFERRPVQLIFSFRMDRFENYEKLRWIIVNHTSNQKVFFAILGLNR